MNVKHVDLRKLAVLDAVAPEAVVTVAENGVLKQMTLGALLDAAKGETERQVVLSEGDVPGFMGTTAESVNDGMCMAENPAVWWSELKNQFVYEDGGVMYAQHALSAVYGDAGKVFRCGACLYLVEAATLCEIGGITVSTKVAEGDENAVSGDAVFQELKECVKKVSGKGLSSADFTAEEKQKLFELHNYDDNDLRNEMGRKVNAVPGKGLSTEDYTTEDKRKLAGLHNYDDTELRGEVAKKVEAANMATINGQRLDEKKNIVIGGGEGGGSVNVDTSVIEGSQNAVSGGAVYNEFEKRDKYWATMGVGNISLSGIKKNEVVPFEMLPNAEYIFRYDGAAVSFYITLVDTEGADGQVVNMNANANIPIFTDRSYMGFKSDYGKTNCVLTVKAKESYVKNLTLPVPKNRIKDADKLFLFNDTADYSSAVKEIFLCKKPSETDVKTFRFFVYKKLPYMEIQSLGKKVTARTDYGITFKNNTVYELKVNNNATEEYPLGTVLAYIVFSDVDKMLNEATNDNSNVYIAYASDLKNCPIIAKSFMAQNATENEIIIPDVVNVVEGLEINLWNDNVSLSIDKGLESPVNYRVNWIGKKGNLTRRGLKFRPSSKDVGNTYDCRCSLYKPCENTKIAEKEFNFRVLGKNQLDVPKNICFFSDSLGESTATQLYKLFHSKGKKAYKLTVDSDNYKKANLLSTYNAGGVSDVRIFSKESNTIIIGSVSKSALEIGDSGIITENDTSNTINYTSKMEVTSPLEYFGGTIPTFRGTCKNASVGTDFYFDAVGGNDWSSYATKGEDNFMINSEGSASDGAVYKIANGNEYIIREHNVAENRYRLEKKYHVGWIDSGTLPDGSGVLTKVNGTGDAVLNYTNARKIPANPLWIGDAETGHLDIAQYKQRIGLTAEEKIDAVAFLLGGNDRNHSLDVIEQQFKELYSLFVADNPQCKVLLGLTPSTCNDVVEGSANYDIETNAKIHDIRKLYIKLSKEMQNVRIVPASIVLDRFYGFAVYERFISDAYSEMLAEGAYGTMNTKHYYHNNVFHPNYVGYREMAAAYMSAYIAALTEK